MSKSMFSHINPMYENPQQATDEMIKAFSDFENQVIDENNLRERGNSYPTDFVDGCYDVICKSIDVIIADPNNTQNIDNEKQEIQFCLKLQKGSIQKYFADIESLSYKKGFRDAFKLFMELTN